MGDTKIKWESLSDLDNSFPEPEKPKEKSILVRVIHDIESDTYTAYWGKSEWASGTAPSAATALRLLANELEQRNLHGSDRELMSDLARKADVLCKYCYAPIFFAILPSRKFLSFDPEPVPASRVVGIRTARFGRGADRRGRPEVIWQGPTTVGPTWIPHPECCPGQKSDPPENEELRKRWQQRRQISDKKKQRVIDGLRDIASDITKEFSDAHSD